MPPTVVSDGIIAMPVSWVPGSSWWLSQARNASGSAPTGVLLPWPAGAAEELKSEPPGERDSTAPPGALVADVPVERRWEPDARVGACPVAAAPAPGGSVPADEREPAAVGRLS